MKAEGAIVIEDPFASSGFSGLARLNGEFDDRGLESIAYDMEHWLRRMGPSAAAPSFAALKALLPEDPFGPDGYLGIHVKTLPVTAGLVERSDEGAGSLRFPSGTAGLSRDIQRGDGAARAGCARLSRSRSARYPEFSPRKPTPPRRYPRSTSRECPGVTVPAGRFANGCPFSLIFVGRMWRRGGSAWPRLRLRTGEPQTYRAATRGDGLR